MGGIILISAIVGVVPFLSGMILVGLIVVPLWHRFRVPKARATLCGRCQCAVDITQAAKCSSCDGELGSRNVILCGRPAIPFGDAIERAGKALGVVTAIWIVIYAPLTLAGFTHYFPFHMKQTFRYRAWPTHEIQLRVKANRSSIWPNDRECELIVDGSSKSVTQVAVRGREKVWYLTENGQPGPPVAGVVTIDAIRSVLSATSLDLANPDTTEAIKELQRHMASRHIWPDSSIWQHWDSKRVPETADIANDAVIWPALSLLCAILWFLLLDRHRYAPSTGRRTRMVQREAQPS